VASERDVSKCCCWAMTHGCTMSKGNLIRLVTCGREFRVAVTGGKQL
jgi:hypothetical protein